MHHRTITVALFAGILLGGTVVMRSGQESDSSIVIGTRVSFESKILGERRALEIYLPGGYERSAETYPVLFVLDGGWMFQYCVSIVHMMSPNHFPRMIVVGIPNTDRRRDLDPAAVAGPEAESGTDRFLRFMRGELIPYVQEKYRVNAFRILTGHSLAGFFTLYAFLKSPETFRAYIATSPSIASEERSRLFSRIMESRNQTTWRGRSLYVSGGGNEGPEMKNAIVSFEGKLNEGLCPGLEWSMDIFDGEGHVPVKGFYQGLRRLFADWMISRELLAKADLSEISRHYEALAKKFGLEIGIPADILASIGRQAMAGGRIPDAIKIYERYITQYPNQAEGFVYLAEALVKSGRRQEGIKSYRRALEIDPGHEAAARALAQLLKK